MKPLRLFCVMSSTAEIPDETKYFLFFKIGGGAICGKMTVPAE